MSDLHSANLQVLLCGWLPWLFELLRLSSAALERFGTNCSALSQRIASDCMLALVGLLVWLSPSEYNQCVRQRSVGSVGLENENVLLKNFLPFDSFSDHRCHSLHSSHRIHWICGCRESHTTNIDCLCPSHPLTAMALFLSLSLPSFSSWFFPQFIFQFFSRSFTWNFTAKSSLGFA